MGIRRWIYAVLSTMLAFSSNVYGASVRTRNFVVEAPTQELAYEFGKLAEHYRYEKAMEWIGKEMQPWPSPCPLRITVTMGGAKGATTFTPVDHGYYQTMFIEGPLERLRNSVLPHEITHTVFYYHFKRPGRIRAE